jgi:hypothetical protein
MHTVPRADFQARLPKQIWPAAFRLIAIVICCASVAFNAMPPQKGGSSSSPKPPVFENDVLPIFDTNCLRCHDSKTMMGRLDLSSIKGILAGGASGPVVEPGKPEASPLYSMVLSGTMPLDHSTQVSPAQMQTIRVWIGRLAADGSASQPASQSQQPIVTPIAMHAPSPGASPGSSYRAVLDQYCRLSQPADAYGRTDARQDRRRKCP